MTDRESQNRFEGMTPVERKRAQERIILEMVYDPTEFAEITERERPDFSLRRLTTDDPFGVEVTQVFENESIARLNLLDGYMAQLFEGGRHRHKDDVKRLDVVEFTISDKDGVVKQDNVRGVIAKRPTREDFRKQLAQMIRGKSARGYDASYFSHLNLIILDWFHLGFDPGSYSSTDFLDSEVRGALLNSRFHEVYLISYDTTSDAVKNEDGAVTPQARIAPLQQLLIVERFFLTGSAIDAHSSVQCSDVAHLGRLTAQHVTQALGIGVLVEHQNQVCVRYRGTIVSLDETGVKVFEHGDYPYSTTSIEPHEVLPDTISVEVTESVDSHAFGWGYTLPARTPWNPGDDQRREHRL